MRNEFNSHLLKSAFFGCAIPTGIINGLLAYFLGHEKTFIQAAIDMNVTIAACAFIVAVLVYPIMLKLSHTLPDPGVSREDLPLFKALPANAFGIATIIMILATIVFGLIPTAILAIFKPSFGVMNYAVLKGVYTGLVVIPVNYVATAMSKLVSVQVKI